MTRPGGNPRARALISTVFVGVIGTLVVVASGHVAHARTDVWTSHGPGVPTIYALAIDPESPATLYAGTSTGVFKSTDGATTWQPATTGMPEYIYVNALAIDPTRAATLYAGTDSGGFGTDAGVFKSTDGATTWQPATTGMPEYTYVKALAIDPTRAATLYAGTDSGVFKSRDGATTWQALNTGLPDYGRVGALAIHPATPTTLYAGTDGVGVFSIQQVASTPTKTVTATQTPIATRSRTATSTPTPTPTVTPTPRGGCAGDCDGTRSVTVANLILLVNIALGIAEPSACSRGVAAGATVDVAFIVQAVNNAIADAHRAGRLAMQ